MEKSKQATIWIAVALTMVMVGFGMYQHQAYHGRTVNYKPSAVSIVAEPAQVTTSSVATTPAHPDYSTAPSAQSTSPLPIYSHKKITHPVPPLSYGDMVNKYIGSRIQFDQNCQAIPSQQVLASPATIMLDNRSDFSQKITINNQLYTVAAYNYVIINLSSKNFPASFYINCNNQVNAGVLVLE